MYEYKYTVWRSINKYIRCRHGAHLSVRFMIFGRCVAPAGKLLRRMRGYIIDDSASSAADAWCTCINPTRSIQPLLSLC